MYIRRRAALIYTAIFCFILLTVLFPERPATESTVIIPTPAKNTSQKRTAITIDCGWTDQRTEELLQILEHEDAKATFFVTAKWAEQHSESLQKMHNCGHEIGSHSAAHKGYPSLTWKEKTEDLKKSCRTLQKITGVPIYWFRPPYGDTDRDTLSAAREAGLYTVLWDLDSMDWKNISPETICKNILLQCEDRDILMFQNGAVNTASALKRLIPEMKLQGWKFMTLSQLMKDT